MKTISLSFSLLLITFATSAQWNLGGEIGINKQRFAPNTNRSIPPVKFDTQSPVTFYGSLYAIYETEMRVNGGLGISVRRNSVNTYLNGGDHTSGVNELSIEHKSVFLSVHPIVDVSIDNSRFFHVMVHPNLSFYAGGSENGFRQYITGERITYTNSTKNINKLALGISGQLQFRYPITKQIRATMSVGYSFNNTISKYVLHEKGNIFAQIGVVFHLPKSGKTDDSTDKKEDKLTGED